MRKKIKESLVTDQPGRKVVFSGLIISILLGFFIKGLTKPEFLQAELKRSVSRIHSSTQVNWGAAQVSLKNGLWPRFSILIHDVRIVSEESCWGQPLLYARELELPVSFVSFFESGQPLKVIYVRDAFLELKSAIGCQKKNEHTVALKAESQEKKSVEAGAQAIRLKPMKDVPQAPPLVLTHFIFENLKLRQTDWAFPDWNFKTFDLNVKENRPWYAEVKADFHIPDMDGVDTGAQLNAVYKEFPSQVLEVKVKGHWREGAFQVNGLWEGAQKGWSYQSKFNHIPFQFLKTVAQRTKTPWNWPDKPMWFSFSTQTVVPFTNWEKSQHFVRGMEIEGDLGDLSIPDLEIKSWRPFKVQPFAFSVVQADLSVVFEKDLKRVGFLSSLGKLSGQGQWGSEKDVLFTGRIEQIQVPIFHRDQKMIQMIRSIDLQAELKNGQWKMSSQKWDLDKGNILGNFRLESNQNVSTGQMQFNLDNFQIDTDLLKFMEIVNPDLNVQGRLNARWRNSEFQELTGQLKANHIVSRAVEIDNPVLSLKKNANNLELRLQSTQFKVRELTGHNLDSSALAQLQFPYESKTTNGLFQWDANQNMKWTLTSAQIRSSGTLEQNGNLKGTLNLGQKTLELSGSRRTPQFLLLR